MRRAVALLVVALTIALVVPLTAQRDGGAGQGGGGRSGGGVARGGAIAPQGRGAQGGFARGRGNDVQGTSSIRGLVTAGDTNTPLRRAQVTAISPETRSSRSATTDATGRFELLNLPAGRWTVTASKGGFVSQQYGQRRAFESVEPLDLGDGQRVTANFTLPRGGVITGRITDEYGDAVTGARVEVLRSQMTQGRRRLTPVSVSSQTDDTGAFRVFGLAPGDYYISARQQPMPFDFGDGPMVFAATFYPGSTNVAEAQRIKVEASSEQSGINFALTSVGAVRVSGTVLDSTGAPAAATVMLQSASSIDGPFGAGAQGRSQADGSFTIRNVAPGEYTLEVMTGQGGRGGGRGGGASFDVASLPLVVGSEDVTGLTITTSKGGTIRGTVVADAGSGLATDSLQISMQSLGGLLRGNGLVSQVTTAGAFDLTGLAGSYVLRVDRVPDGWTVKSITVNGKDASDLPIEVRGTDQFTARVVLTNHINELTGTVRSGGQTVTSASVVIFPDNPAQWGFPSRRVRTARVDANGLFRIRSLPAGQRYLAVAVDYLEQGEFQDPEFLQKMKARATEVTLGEAETKNFELTLVER